MTSKKLQGLHNIVKDHPFRMRCVTGNENYKKHYCDAYRKLIDETYKHYSKKDKALKECLSDIFHNTRKFLWTLEIMRHDHPEVFIYLENSLSILHYIIDNDKAPDRYLKYDANAKNPIKMRLVKELESYRHYYEDKNKYLQDIDDAKKRYSDEDICKVIVSYYQDIYDNYEKYF